MTPSSNIPGADAPDTTVTRRRWPVWLRACAWTGGVVTVVAVAAVVLVLTIVGQTVRAPDWVLDRVETWLESSLNGFDIEFGDIQMVINEGWRPRARLLDLTLFDPSGARVVQLQVATASLAMRPLLQGQVRPKTIGLSGGFATIQRAEQGQVSVVLADPEAPVREAEGLLDLLDTVEAETDSPLLSALTEVELSGMTVRYEDAQSGRAWLADGSYAKLSRLDDTLRLTANLAVLAGGADVSTVELNYEGAIDGPQASFGVSITDVPAQDIASQAQALAWLTPLRAPISGSMRGTLGDDGSLGVLNASLHIGAGALQPTEAVRPIPFQGARSYFEFDPVTETIRFDELSVESDWLTGRASGSAQLVGLSSGTLQELVSQITVSELVTNPANTYAEPLTLVGAQADFRLKLDPFQLDLGEMYVEHADTNILLKSRLTAATGGWHLDLDGSLDAITPEALMQLWPQKVSPKPRKWVSENLTGGQIRNGQFAVRSEPGAKPVVYLNTDFEGSSIRFLKTMPPISDTEGMFNLVDGRFVVTTTKGQIMAPAGGAVDVSGTSFIIPDVGIKKRAPGVVRARASGNVTAVLSLLDEPPLRILRDVTFPVSVAEGQAVAIGTIALPLAERVQFEEIDFHVDGTLRDVSSDFLVPGHTVVAKELSLTASSAQVALSGQGAISGVPAEVAWAQKIGPGADGSSTVSGTIALGPETVEAFEIGLPDGMLSGAGSGTFEVALGKGAPPRLTLNSDLVGLSLQIPELGWQKTASNSGNLSVSAQLGPDPGVDALNLSGAGLSVEGRLDVSATGGLELARFNSVRVGNWLNAQVDLVGRGKGVSPNIRIRSGSLDLQNAQFGTSANGGDAPERLDVVLDQLQITETWALTDFVGQFDPAGGLSGPFQGRLNGRTKVNGDLVPENGRLAFRITSNDAGGVLKSGGLLTQARGGTFQLILRPVEDEGSYDGTLTVENTSIHDAPAMAALLNAVSIVGLLDEMSGQGIQFSRVDARFRLDPDQLTLFEGSAVGPSIGLSMDGRYDVARKFMNMQGVISPAYFLNGIGQVVSRRGEGLIGFNYNLVGPASKPNVTVNPLSALAPGFLRGIFRATAPPEDPSEPDDTGYQNPVREER